MLEDHPLSAVLDAYSIHSQLPSVSGGRLPHPQSEDAPCSGDKGPTLHGLRVSRVDNVLPADKYDDIVILKLTDLYQYV
jgi:hypothetical protein